MTLVDDLIKEGWLKSPDIIKAFRNIKREDFLVESTEELAELDEALPIGSGQTISQPLTVAFMLELLQPKLEDKVLDVGAGSGWTTAILAEVVNEKGNVVAIEVIPELAEFGKNNVAKYGFKNVEYVCSDGSKGFKKLAPYDKILVSAATENVSDARFWKEQLKIGGRLVCVIQNSIWLFIKQSEDEFQEKEYPGFIFVPLVKS